MQVNNQEVIKILEEVKPSKLIAATKYVTIDEINELEKLGVTYFGENRVPALLEKYEKYHGKGQFHLIGTLQTNKVKYIIDKVSLIHSVDSYQLIKEIEKQATKHNLIMPILIQVNIAKEETKHGFNLNELDEVFKYLLTCKHITVDGLMMMAPNLEASIIEGYFEQTAELLKELKGKYPTYELTQLSMGMSNDYKIALKHGATMIRIGQALFK